MAESEAHWLWDDPDHGGYTKFDDQTSAQIEERFKKALLDKTKGPIEVQLSKGPWFGISKNQGIYSAVLIVDCTDPKDPIINEARQTNTNSGFKRPIRRYPPLDPPLAAKDQAIVSKLDGKWEWKDDAGWKEYDLLTMQQVEAGYKNKSKLCDLSAGDWFGKAGNKGVYFIEYNYLSLPCSAQQHNKKSHYGRWVRRIPTKQIEFDEELSKQQNFFLKNDKHFLWRKYYFPLSKEDFGAQKKEDLKCSICLEQFTEEGLLENQKQNKINKVEIIQQGSLDPKDDQKDNKSSKKQVIQRHKYDLTKMSRYVSDTTCVGLKRCTYGHYFHGECILNALSASRKCPICACAYGKIIGHQPEGRLYVTCTRSVCSGYSSTNTIKLLFEFPGGIQSKYHPNPGKIYFGDLREAFLPNTEEGRECAMLTRLAFKRKLIFSIGKSLTLNQDNRIIFGSVHLKTSINGGVEKHGYPDKEYFARFKKELKIKGITSDQLGSMENEFIKNNFPQKNK